jgi:septum formation topological specificity factor MinE
MNTNQEIANDSSFVSEISVDVVEVKKEEERRRNEWLKEKMELRRKQQIQFIIAQTNYDEMKATQKLEECKNDVIKVVSDYLGIVPKKDKSANKTKNQKIFSVIRDIMDSGSRNFIIQQEKAKKIEEIKKYTEIMNNSNNNSNNNNSNNNDSNNNDSSRVHKEKID